MMNIDREDFETDVIVVGSGGAGLRAAIEAGKKGKVTVLSRGPFGRGGATVMAGADIMLDGKSLCDLGYKGDPDDTKEKWFQDILVEGFDLNDQGLVEAYVREAPDRIRELLDWGMKVDSERSEFRALITTGAQILQALGNGFSRSGASVFENCIASDIMVHDDRVCGLMALDYRRGKIIHFRTKAVILATGGWHELYAFNTGSDDLTGDGPAMAYRAGAVLSNMEMTTFCPNIILHPAAYRGTVFLYNFLTGRLLKKKGDAFLAWEDPRILKLIQTTEWNKLLLSRAIWNEVVQGRGTPHGGVYYSLRHVPIDIFEELEKKVRGKAWRFQGRDVSGLVERLKDGYAVEVGPAAHYFEGGIKISPDCETSVPGLYAAGECTGGLFGANRVSAATTEMLVQGAIAGRTAMEFALRERRIGGDERQADALEENLILPLGRQKGERPSGLKTRIQDVAYRNLGVIRNRTGLEASLEKAEELQRVLSQLCVPERKSHNRAWVDALDVRNLMELLKVVARSALEREESRGVHFRDDFPDTDDTHGLKNVLVRKEGGRIKVNREALIRPKGETSGRIRPYEETIRDAIEALSY